MSESGLIATQDSKQVINADVDVRELSGRQTKSSRPNSTATGYEAVTQSNQLTPNRLERTRIESSESVADPGLTGGLFLDESTVESMQSEQDFKLANARLIQTYLNNMFKHEVGLLDTKIRIGDNMYPANIFTIDSINELVDKAFLLPKPTKKEKGGYNDHKTVKPLAICEYLINLSAFSKNAVVLDPFIGSGTTAVAAKKLGKNYIGIEANEKYVKISEERIKELDEKPDLFKIEKVERKNLQMELQVI